MRGGFTLMEVVVALAITGISLAMLTAQIGTGLTNAKLSGQYIEAVRRAQSHLEVLDTEDKLAVGDTDGDDGGGFAWQIHIEQTNTRPPISGPLGKPGMAVYGVDVTMSWQSGDIKKNISLWSEQVRTF